MEKLYQKKLKQIYESYQSGPQGLSGEAIERNRKRFGENQLEEGQNVSILKVFATQFKDFLVLMLVIAAVISGMMGKWESTLVIVAVLLLNAVLGTIQHIKAEQSLKGLKALASPSAKVFRDGDVQEIESKDVVVGDILLVEAGDLIAADARIIESNSLQVGESALTGESISVDKFSGELVGDEMPLGDQSNMIFSSSHVTYGRGKAIVVAVGANTEIGKIASLLKNAQEKKTPLQENLDQFGRKLSFLIMMVSSLIFIMNFMRGMPVMDALMFAISLAVAAIPEALSSIVTIVLALGTRKLAAENAIVRKLHAVEMLGSVSVICSDKTGTLTQNKMTVQKIYVDHALIEVAEIDVKHSLQRKLIQAGLLCSDAVTTQEKAIGDPTEIALVDLGERFSIDEQKIRKDYPRVSELPFDSDRKLMSTLQTLEDESLVFTKGAMDVLIKRATKIETAQGIRVITAEDIEKFHAMNYELSSQGLRVLAFGWRTVNDKTLTFEHESELTLLGLVAMMDPPRVESRSSVEACVQAGIKPVMITGDHKVTASAIAREIGILSDVSQAVEGSEIENLTDDALKALVPKVSVYARVSPEHKIRIVNAWQELGHVVAMTGDGVNDAPALKKAHIGIAMGITGTEVSKEASSMILTDDNFATIVKAVNNGRCIYGNIKNAIRFLLSGNTAGILAVLYASLMGLGMPFMPVHLLFINLLTDSLPAIAIGLEPAHGNLMKRSPRDPKAPIMDGRFMRNVGFEGLLIAVVTMVAFHMGKDAGGQTVAMTMAFMTLSLSRLVHGLNCRMETPLTPKSLFKNPWIFIAQGTGVGLLLLVLSFAPLRNLFEVTPLSLGQLGIVFGLSLMPLVLVQAVKWMKKKRI